jgi:hypothetical protein
MEGVFVTPADAMEGVFLTPAELDKMSTSLPFSVQTNTLTEDIVRARFVFGPQQLKSPGTSVVIVDDAVHVEEVRDDASIDMDVTTMPIAGIPVDIGNKRPRRAAAVKATKVIKNVLKWERCKESSSMFQEVAHEINQEFDRVTHSKHGVKKTNLNFIASNLSTDDGFGFVDHSDSDQQKGTGVVVDTAVSDDECNALKSDEEDNDDDESDDDDAGSLASFVVDDDYISDLDEPSHPCKKTKYESQSESDSDADQSCSDDDNETVQCDDDSEQDFSDDSVSEVDSDASVDMEVDEAKVVELVEVMEPMEVVESVEPVEVMEPVEVVEPVEPVEVVEPVEHWLQQMDVVEQGGFVEQDLYTPISSHVFHGVESPTNIENFFG